MTVKFLHFDMKLQTNKNPDDLFQEQQPPDPPSSNRENRSPVSPSSYPGVAHDVSLHDGSKLLLVVKVGEPVLPFSLQGLEGLVGGPENGERLVDGHLEHRQQPCILLKRWTEQSCRTNSCTLSTSQKNINYHL